MNKKVLFLNVIFSLVGLYSNCMNYVARSMMKKEIPVVTGKTLIKHILTSPKTYGSLINWITSFASIPVFAFQIKNQTEIIENNLIKQELTQEAKDLLNNLDIDPNLIYLIRLNEIAFSRDSKKYGPRILINEEFFEKLNKGDKSISYILLHEKNHLENNDFKRWSFFQPILHTGGVLVAHKLFKPVALIKNTLTKTRPFSSPGKIKNVLLYPWEIVKGITCGITKSIFGTQLFNVYMRKREQAADDDVFHSNPQKLDTILKEGEECFSEFATNHRKHQIDSFPKILQPVAEYIVDPNHPKLETRIAKIQTRRRQLREKHPDLFKDEELLIKN